MERLGSWVLYFVSSAIVAATMADDFQLGYDSIMGSKIDIVFGISCATMVLSLLFIIGHATCSAKIIGGYFELGITAISSAMWILAIMYAVDPTANLAISIISGTGSVVAGYFNEGQELIVNANLFFFSWISFLSGIYIVISLFSEKFKIEDKTFTQWLLVLISGVTLVANNINSLDAACDTDGNKTCARVKLAVGVGAVGILMSLIVTIMAMLKKSGGMIQLVVNMITVAVYLAGTALLTSATGQARVMGNTYFAVWGGFAVSGMLFHDLITEKFLKSKMQGAKISDSEAV